MRRLVLVGSATALAIIGCSGWSVQPMQDGRGTAVSSRTPTIRTATAIVVLLPPSLTAAITMTPREATQTSQPMVSATPTETPTESIGLPTFETATLDIHMKLLGCDTGFDLTHGMGEVTNAYITIINDGATGAFNICVTLSGLDEGRPHPDKTVCLADLPSGYSVTLKLTVDTTYREDSPVQIDLFSQGGLLERIGQPSCPVIRILPAQIGGLGTPRPSP